VMALALTSWADEMECNGEGQRKGGLPSGR
jgi:hypothetical protein